MELDRFLRVIVLSSLVLPFQSYEYILLGKKEGGQIIQFPGSADPVQEIDGPTHIGQGLIPGIPYKQVISFRPHVSLDLLSDQTEENNVKLQILHDIASYEICVEASKIVCQRIAPIGGHTDPAALSDFWTLRPRPPQESRGLSRISSWLQQVDADSGGILRVVGNVTFYLWESEVEAVTELQRLLHDECAGADSLCGPVVREHLLIAESRLPRYLAAQAEPRGPRQVRSVGVVTTMFNSKRVDKPNSPVEGLWLLPFATAEPSVRFIAYSATRLDDGRTFEASIPDDDGRISEASIPRNIEVIPFPNPGRAQECPGIFRFIIDRYDDLPDVTFFLHGYPFDHNPYLDRQLSAFFRLNRRGGIPGFQFIHLNYEVFNQCYRNSAPNSISKLLGLDDELLKSWPREALGTAETKPCYVSRFCCGQFAVSKESIRRRTKDFYLLALKLTLDQRDCAQMENLWHAVFRSESTYTGLNLGEFLHAMGEPF